MKKGCSMLGVLFTLLFIGSIALNAFFVVGCNFFHPRSRMKKTDFNRTVVSSVETRYLREIADILKIGCTPEKTQGDIAAEIQQRLSESVTYTGSVLTSEAFAKANSAIRIAEDQETFKSYHEFVGKIAGKKLIILE